MPLKYQVEKLEDIEEAQRPLYVEDKEAGVFRLAVDGLDDGAELKRAKQHEVEARRKAEKELKELRDSLATKDAENEKARQEALKKAGDVDALEKSWKDKLSAREQELIAERDTQVSSLAADVTRLTADADALKIASELAVDADSVEALLPHVRRRLTVDVRDGKRVSVVVDGEGRPTAASLADLSKELKASKPLARLIKASQGSGGGAGGSANGGGAPKSGKKRSEMTTAEKSAFVKEHGQDEYFKLPA